MQFTLKFWFGLLAVGSASLACHSATQRPNVVVILADDLGFGDLRSYNPRSQIPTPTLDRMATEGIRFTDAHAPAAVCSPTRYALLTGRYAWRTWLKTGVLDGFDPPLIEEGRATLASWLRGHGYATACFGKWHLGLNWTRHDGSPVPYRRPVPGSGGFRAGTDVDLTRELQGGPMDRGFDLFFGISASLDMSPYAFIEGRRLVATRWRETPEERSMFMNQVPGVRADDFAFEEVLPTLTRRAVEFVESRGRSAAPFFLYLPLPSPHLPIVPKSDWQGKSGVGPYGDFVAQTDGAVSEVLSAIERAGIKDNTLVIFTSDNGSLFHEWTAKEADDVAAYQPTPRAKYAMERGHQSNGHLRGTKGDIYEGGHRVPLIVRWPAGIKGARVSNALIELNDVFATLAEILGETLPPRAAEDSFSFAAELTGRATAAAWPARPFGVHHSLMGVFALREGPWKYVPARGSGGFSSPRNVAPATGSATSQLYNLETDPAEERNLADHELARVSAMAERLRTITAGSGTR